MRKPKADATRWRAWLHLKDWRGDEGTSHEDIEISEAAAIRAGEHLTTIFGDEWYKMEVWIIPPKGQGRPKRHYRKVQRQHRKKPKAS